jgi:hypothetical protein
MTDQEAIFNAMRIAAEFIPIFDELTSSDLQGCVGAEVSKLGLPFDRAIEVEDLALEYIYSHHEQKQAGA